MLLICAGLGAVLFGAWWFGEVLVDLYVIALVVVTIIHLI